MRQRKPNLSDLDKRLDVTIDNCAAALDCGRGKIYSLINKGLLKTFDVDGMRSVTGESLRALMAEQQEI